MKRFFFLAALFVLVAFVSLNAQIISTVAGGGPTYPLPALNAPLANPQAVAFDANGNYYVASNNHVYKVDMRSSLTLFAGNGVPCAPQTPPPNCGDGGPAVNANLRHVYGLAVDPAGNVYIADTASARIRKVDTTGIITTFAGNGNHGYSGDEGPATSASLGQPYGISADPMGDVYIADPGEQRVRLVDPSGIIHTFAGNGTGCGRGPAPACGDGGLSTMAGLGNPWAVAASPMGVFIAERAGRIRLVAPMGPNGGPISTVLGVGSPLCPNGPPCIDPASGLDATLASPIAVTTIQGGSFIGMIDAGRNQISTELIISPPIPRILLVTGNCWNELQGAPCAQTPLAGPNGLAPWGGTLYVAGGTLNQVATTTGILGGGPLTPVAGNGTPFYYGDSIPATQASFSTPPGVAVDAAGNIYIPDMGDNCVRMVSAATGEISTIAGIPGNPGYSGDGGSATSANLNGPSSVLLDGQGNLYIADNMNGVVRMVNASGAISTIAGNGNSCMAQQPGLSAWMGYCYTGDGGPATSAGLGSPLGMALDTAGNLYIADNGNNLILKVAAATGLISTVAGNGTQCNADNAAFCYSGDGGPATGAALFTPNSVSVDAAGKIYIADSNNNSIRVVDASPSHIITTLAGNAIAGPGYGGDGGPAYGALLNTPEGIQLDSAGNLLIADTGNNLIREINGASGFIATVVGNGNQGFSGDGGSPLNASLYLPSWVYADKAGGLWISDSGNRRIRSVGNTPTGNNVSVAPLSSTAGTSPVMLSFSTVTSPGNVSLATSTTGPALPAGFQSGTPATYYMIETSAVYSGSIQICINYSGVSFTDPSQLSIWHYDTTQSAWTQLATTVNTAITTACATTPSLSPFALLQPAYVAQIQPPINADGTSVFTAKRGVVPVKFTLTLSGVKTCKLPPATISLSLASSTIQNPISGSLYLMPSDNGSNFRIDTGACQYVYNLGAGSLGTGNYKVSIVTGGATIGNAVFGLK